MKGLLKGLGVTFSVFTRKPVTVQYPDEKHVLPVRQRSFPVLTWDFDHDEPFCTGCNVCVRNCPVDCMTATMMDNPNYTEGTSNRRKIVEKFWIDYGRCMRCNICVEVCPFEAIVMDNNWSGHEHAAFDRRDLHLDLEALTKESREGTLQVPFRPQDNIEVLERTIKGEELPEESFKGAKPEARRRQQERVERGEERAIRLREPEKPKAAAAAAAGAGAAGGEVEILSESKIRAKRMRAERKAKEYQDRGEAVPADVLADIEKYRNMKPGVPYTPGGAAAGAMGTGEVLTGTNPDGSMRFPPGVGTGPKGDPNSPEKVRARRMRAERKFNELTAAGEEIPEDVAKTLYDLGSDLAPGGSIWQSLAGTAGGGAAAGVPLTGTNPDGSMRFPPGVGDGPKGDPNSPEKVRARRMRAERKFKELTAAGEEIPEDVAKTLYDLGSDLAPGGSIWEKELNQAGAGGGAAAAPAVQAHGGTNPDGSMRFPPGVGDGPKGDPNSPEKVRARRMRAERKFKELNAAGEEIPDDVTKTLYDLGSDLAPGGSIWVKEHGEAPVDPNAAPAAATAAAATTAATASTPNPPQPQVTQSAEATVDAAAGEAPPPAPGAAGESAPGEPSRAEIASMNPEAVQEDALPGTPTKPEGPVEGEPHVAGAPVAGQTEVTETAPPSERPAATSTPEERHEDEVPPKAPLQPDDPAAQGQEETEPERPE